MALTYGTVILDKIFNLTFLSEHLDFQTNSSPRH